MKSPSPDLSGQKYYIYTFGCQMNVNDSEHIAGLLTSFGALPSDSPEESSLIIVNTCAVRKKPVDKIHSLLGRLKHLKQKNRAVIGVTGCVAQLHRREILDQNPFVDFVVGPDNYWQLPDMIGPFPPPRTVATEWHREWHETPSHIRFDDVSGYITIMEGCDNFCSYCVVPFTRGREKYRPLSLIIAEAESLEKKGYQEIQLLGQNVNSYKDPETGTDFAELLAAVGRIKGIAWIRFITSHPKDFTREVAEAMRGIPQVCPQLHLPLQAGSDTVLQRMKRGYTRELYLEKIAMLRQLMPDIALSTDIIVGFPGENEDDFQQTLEVLRSVRFTNIYSFRYSPRPKTAAARYEDDVPDDEKRDRLLRVQNLQKEIQLESHRALIGREMEVLALGRSKKDPQVFQGRNTSYQVINFTAANDPTGKFVTVSITDCGAYSLRGEVRKS